MVLKIFFLFFNNVDVKFVELEKLTWRIYITAEVLLTTSWVKFIDKKEFAKGALNKKFENLVVHIVVPKAKTLIYLLQIAQIAALQ